MIQGKSCCMTHAVVLQPYFSSYGPIVKHSFSGVPYHHLLFNDTREPLVEVCSQLLAICFEKQGEEKIAESIDDENGNKVSNRKSIESK